MFFSTFYKKSYILSFIIILMMLWAKNWYALDNKVCYEWIQWNWVSCINSNEKLLTDYLNDFSYTNWVFWQGIDFRNWKSSYSFSDKNLWSVYSFSIWADFSNKSSTNLSTLVWRNGWTYHHLLIDNTADSWNQFLAVYNNWWFKSNYSIKDLTWWHNITVVVNSSESTAKTKFYIDWNYVASVNTAIDTNSWPISIVWNYRINWDQKAMPLDEFGLWNRVLSQSEINILQWSKANSISSWLSFNLDLDDVNYAVVYTNNIWFTSQDIEVREFTGIDTSYQVWIGHSQVSFSELREFDSLPLYDYKMNIWFTEPSFSDIRTFSLDNSYVSNIGYTDNWKFVVSNPFDSFDWNYVVNLWYSSSDVILNENLFKDNNMNFDTNYFVYNWRWVENNKTTNWFKNVLVCWQDYLQVWTNSLNCRMYYPEKDWKWFVWNKLLNLSIPLSDINDFKINYSSLNTNENKVCFKNTSLCLRFDFINWTVKEDNTTLAWNTIKSNSTYFNNQLVYFNNIWKLNTNINVSSELVNQTDKSLIFWLWNYLLINENNKLKIYNQSYSLINEIDWIEIQDIIKFNNESYFINKNKLNKLYKLNINWELDQIAVPSDIKSKLYAFTEKTWNSFIYFISEKTGYKYSVSNWNLYTKEDLLIDWSINNWNIFPIDRWNNKTEFILFNNFE